MGTAALPPPPTPGMWTVFFFQRKGCSFPAICGRKPEHLLSDGIVFIVRALCMSLISSWRHSPHQRVLSQLPLLLQVVGRKLENGPQETWPPTSAPLCNCSSGFIRSMCQLYFNPPHDRPTVLQRSTHEFTATNAPVGLSASPKPSIP